MSNELDFATKNGWTHYTDEQSRKDMDALAADYIDFLNAKTERETVSRVVEKLRQAGYSEDFTKDLVFRTWRGKAVFAARKGKSRCPKAYASSARTPTPRASTSNSVPYRNRWASDRPRPTITAASANTSGWRARLRCTA